jgi:hypothetical protein
LSNMADVKGLFADPEFQQMDAVSQKAVLGRIDPELGGLSDQELKAFATKMAAPRIPGMEQLGGVAPGPAKVPRIPRQIDQPRLKQDSTNDLSGYNGVMGTLTKDVADSVRTLPQNIFRAARILHPAAAMRSGYNPINDLRDVGNAAISIPTELGSDLIHGRWGKLGARAIEMGLPALNEERLMGASNFAEAAPSVTGKALKGAAKGGYEASKSPAVKVPATVGAGIGELVGGLKGATIGGFAGAAPGMVRGMVRGARSELFPGSVPFTDIPYSAGVPTGDLPFGSRTPVYPPVLRDPTHIANLPGVPPGEVAAAPPSGGRSPLIAPIRSSSGTVVPTPESTFAASVPVEKVQGVLNIGGSGTPVRAPYGYPKINPTQAEIDATLKKYGLSSKITPIPEDVPPKSATPEPSTGTHAGTGHMELPNTPAHYHDLHQMNGGKMATQSIEDAYQKDLSIINYLKEQNVSMADWEKMPLAEKNALTKAAGRSKYREDAVPSARGRGYEKSLSDLMKTWKLMD